MIKTLTKENFEQEVEKSDIPMLVELWAPWCVYCRRLSPALDRLAEKLNGKAAVGKINIDEQPELAEKLDASTIPTLYIYQDGHRSEKLVAPGSQAQVETWLEENGVQ